MRIIPAADLERRLTPHPRTPGVFFVEWQGHLITLHDAGAGPVPARAVDELADRLDARFPVRNIAWTDGLDVLCLPHNLVFLDAQQHPTRRAQGQELPGLVLLSAGVSDIHEVVSHELAHAWARYNGMPTDGDADPQRLAEMAAITGINPDEFDSTAFLWERRWQELLAEHLSAALWDAPLADRIPPLSPGQYVRLAEWARKLTPRTRTITLRIGADVATVDGRAVTLDAPARIVPPGRTVVPLRFVSEALGCRVDWDGDTQTVTITQEVPGS